MCRTAVGWVIALLASAKLGAVVVRSTRAHIHDLRLRCGMPNPASSSVETHDGSATTCTFRNFWAELPACNHHHRGGADTCYDDRIFQFDLD